MSLVKQMKFDPALLSAFGVLETSERMPILQGDYVYGLNTQIWKQFFTFTVTDPGTDPVAGDIYSNNNAYFTVIFNSTTTLICYGSGGDPAASGDLTRVSGSGTTPIAFSAYTRTSGIAFGTGAGVDTNGGRLRVQSGTSSNGFALISSRRLVKYRAGQGTVVTLTPIFTAGVANNVQLQGVGNMGADTNPYDGYFWGFNGTSFGICHYNAGSATWIAQGSWNGDKVDGSAGTSFTWDITKGTPTKIVYPYLGFGNILFFVQNPNTSEWVLVHTIRYANTTNATQLSNPTLRTLHYTKNSGNTSNITMYTGSFGVFISGARSFIGNPKWSANNYKAAVSSEINILSIKNAMSYNGVRNAALVRVMFITIGSSAASGISIVSIKINATLGGTPSYAAISGTTGDNGQTVTSGNSCVSYDTAGTTVTGGTLIRSFTLDNPNSAVIDLRDDNIFIAPGEILTISGFSTIASTISAAADGTEDI